MARVDESFREWLYSEEGLPDTVAAGMLQHHGNALQASKVDNQTGADVVSFLSHAFGQVSCKVQLEAMVQFMALSKLGNPSWTYVYGTLLPAVSRRIRKLLKIPLDDSICTVQFGHNSHELVLRLLSCLLDAEEGSTVRVLTSDTEFYSMTRQLNRLLQSPSHSIQVDVVSAEPADTFASRLLACAAGRQAPDRSLHSPSGSSGSGLQAPAHSLAPSSSDPAGGIAPEYHMVYVSQITYLTQQTLLPDVASTVEALWNSSMEIHDKAPMIVVDGYHVFGAIATDLSSVADKCYYVSGFLKHIGCGPNCAFMTAPSARHLRPLDTGWLADISVLQPGSAGIAIGSDVGYDRELALHGSTAGFMLPLLTFNALMDLWELGEVTGLPTAAELAATTSGTAGGGPPAGPVKVSVAAVHSHVLQLHDRFLEGVKQLEHPVVNARALVNLQQDPEVQSHTLVFQSAGAGEAAEVVEALQRLGCLVDCRKQFVRVGFGFNHSLRDVERLLEALKASCAMAEAAPTQAT